VAFAHATWLGAGSFLSGVVHPLNVPAHLLLLVATGLLISQGVPLRLRGAVVVIVGGAAAGLVVTPWLPESGAVRGLLTGWTGVVGLVVVADWLKSRVARAVLAGIAAFLVGLDSTPGAGAMGATLLTLLGTGTAVVLVVANVAFYVSLRPDRFWAHVGVRVLASWIVAASLMLLAFALRGIN
jgi:urease accessory protein